MPLTTTVSMLRKAQEQGFAVGAFNVENMEMAQAIISAAEELRAPVILQTTPSTVRYAGTGMYAAMVPPWPRRPASRWPCTWTTATALPCAPRLCAPATPA